MKILMIIPHVGKGGDWVMVRTLTRVLRSAGHEVWIGSTSVDDAQRAEFDGHLIWELNRGAAGWVRSLPKIRHIPDDIDIIHAHSPQTTLFGWLLTRTTCRQAGLILTVHWWGRQAASDDGLVDWLFDLRIASIVLRMKLQGASSVI